MDQSTMENQPKTVLIIKDPKTGIVVAREEVADTNLEPGQEYTLVVEPLKK